MTDSQRARSRTRPVRIRRRRVAGLLAVFAALAAALSYELPAASSPTASFAPTAAPPIPVRHSERRDELPGATDLNPDLRGALRQAAANAADDGIALEIDSGRRSPEHQQQLLDEAVVKYGSAEEAARWVATPNRSLHVSGDAVDIGPVAATAWLSAHGAEYGLCQIYGNEPWHYELRPDAGDEGCPPMYADPTQDPRMQQ